MGSALLLGALGLALYWLIDFLRYAQIKRQAAKSTAWADRDRIELFDVACRMAHKTPPAPFEEPQRSYHRRLKDAIEDGKLAWLDLRGTEPSDKTLVSREALRAYAEGEPWPELWAFMREWDRVNPPSQAGSTGLGHSASQAGL